MGRGLAFLSSGVVANDRKAQKQDRSRCRRRRENVVVNADRPASVNQQNDSGVEPPSFEFELPPLYDGWFSQSGVIADQMQTSARRNVDRGVQKLEINFPAVPNVDEVKFGTKLNSMFAEDIATYFGMQSESKKIKRYLIEFANVYWASRLAEAFPEKAVWILFTDPVRKDGARFPPNVKKVSQLKKFDATAQEQLGDNDIVIVCDPGLTDNWKKGATLAGKKRAVFMLNSSFVETYDLCGPLKDVVQAYYVKRVSKGWVYRFDLQPWIAYLERPDGSVEVLQTQQNRLRLGDVSKALRTESFKRYSIYNDRWSPGFGARL